MPSKKTARRAPRASQKKLYKHAFYLLQPFLQFFALVAILVIFARCSPLASSTDKESGLPLSPPPENASQALAAAEEDAIYKNIKDLGGSSVAFLSESDLDKLAGTSQNAAGTFTIAEVRKSKINFIQISSGRLLFNLSKEQQAALFTLGQIRVDLGVQLEHHPKRTRKDMLAHLQEAANHQNLGATAYVILPDAFFHKAAKELDSIDISLKASFSSLSDEKAILELQDSNALLQSNSADAALLKEALEESVGIAILLE